ncbi:DUF3040 domain-containing protein [Lentzea sp. NBC_00516]|uniref:DUF3040 domain-containing protein n=1 Tax=Lentzea sp. NBC_00516 TaxID=2903582 RepID=UPI002E808475|nr:DUF3040 domain-containing protein [Lentzea sp. NBC_00516]WUD27624.1 DUF3040 domain-containing protein [Lentzea sp. NBC_00516]
MLSDRERETLCEIERNLSDEDPKLAETFESARLRAPHDRHRGLYLALLVIAALLSVLAMALGHMTGALACALVAGWTWGAWQRRALRARTHGHDRSHR